MIFYPDRAIGHERWGTVLCMHHPMAMSHQLNILHHSADGYVASCCSCGRFQIAFGTSLFNMHEDMLRGLAHELEQDERYCAARVDPGRKCFAYEVSSDGVQLVMNYTEVKRLRAMLADALWLMNIMEEAGSGTV
jgi:hypothetical protein